MYARAAYLRVKWCAYDRAIYKYTFWRNEPGGGGDSLAASCDRVDYKNETRNRSLTPRTLRHRKSRIYEIADIGRIRFCTYRIGIIVTQTRFGIVNSICIYIYFVPRVWSPSSRVQCYYRVNGSVGKSRAQCRNEFPGSRHDLLVPRFGRTLFTRVNGNPPRYQGTKCPEKFATRDRNDDGPNCFPTVSPPPPPRSRIIRWYVIIGPITTCALRTSREKTMSSSTTARGCAHHAPVSCTN